MNVYLYRHTSIVDGTFGLLVADNKSIAVTCEDPWLDNKPFESCIPAGSYTAFNHGSLKFGNVWKLANVPNRTDILIHQGNTKKDTTGCILVGSRYGTLLGRRAILDSKKALMRLKVMLPERFTLIITNL